MCIRDSPEAFATVREAADRVLGLRHYRVQLLGGIVLHLSLIHILSKYSFFFLSHKKYLYIEGCGMDGVTLDLYRVFVQVAREGSFSAAARSLYLSQPAVSQAILHLERQLKATLFLRSVRGVTLTPEGALLFEHASAALDTLEAGQRKLETLHRLEAGALRVGAGDTATRYYLLPRLSRFSSRFPGPVSYTHLAIMILT